MGGSKVGCLLNRGVHAPFLTPLMSWSLQVSALVSPPLKEISTFLVKGKSVEYILKSMDARFPSHIISPLACHIPCSSPPQFGSHSSVAQLHTFSWFWRMLPKSSESVYYYYFFFEYDTWFSMISPEISQYAYCSIVRKTWSFPSDFGGMEKCGHRWSNTNKYLQTWLKC